MSLKRDIVWRVAVVYFMFLIFGLGIIFKAVFFQIFHGEEYQQKANILKEREIMPNRGDIYASDGRLLASSVPYYEIRLDLNSPALDEKLFWSGIDSLAWNLSNLFRDRSKESYKRELLSARKNGERYHLLKKKVSYNDLKRMKEFPIFRKGRFKGGFIVRQNNVRYKPHISLASRTIGYTTRGIGGNVVGIEGAYDTDLTGIKGKQLMQKINGNLWMPISDRNEVEPQNGYDVITSIDIDLQDVAHSALRRQLAKHEAHHGTAVLMEVKTGDVKAIANLERNEDGRYREVYNYAIGESSEPGSTFKLPVIMAAMEDGYININDSVDTGNGRIRYYDKIVKDEKEGGYGKLTVREVIEFSSNVGISKIITDCYTGREHEFIDRLYGMRLNEKLDVEIKGEGVPHIKYPKDKYWSGISLPMISHGYEVTMTPLQILTFYNAVANDGKMVKPRFVKELRQNGRIIKHFGVDVLNPTICSASTIRKAQQMLEGVVERGTARNLKNANFRIAGKTGTAQIANEKYGYKIGSKVSYQASFVGYFPADNPKYSCIVIINSPSRNVYYGNLVAGPVFKEIANKVYATGFESHDEFLVRTDTLIDPPYSKCGYMPELDQVFAEFNIPVKKDEPAQNWVLTYKRDSLVALKNHEIVPRLVPNVKDMGAKDAVYLLENAGLKVKIVGRGKVMSQSLRPGSRIHKGQKIVLTMSFT